MNIAKKDILKFTFLPGFIPRLKELFASGFQYVPYFIALVYGAVKLLPANHPYLQGENIGKYGLRHVIAAAANNLEFSRNRIDQVILFFTILIGLVIVMIQLFLLAFVIISQPAMAAMPTNFAGFFLQATEQDLAYMMLDLVFGVPDVFNSCVGLGTACLDGEGNTITSPNSSNWGLENQGGVPFPIHQGLHRLFTIYSLGLLVVAVFISLYFMVTVIAETAQSGTPFGKRFNKVWAPIRIVVAFGLLIPIGVGMNASQYIVLYAAKFGTGFANQGWKIFNSNLTQLHGIGTVELVAQPNIPEVGALLQFLFTAKTCAEVENITNDQKGREPIMPYLVRGQLSAKYNFPVAPGSSYADMITWADGDMQVVMRFGREEIDNNAKQAGYIAPTCGELVIPFTDPRTAGEPAVMAMQQYYWYIIREIWYQVLPGQGGFINGLGGINYPENYMFRYMTSVEGHIPNAPIPESSYKTKLLEFYQDDVRAAMSNPGSTGISGVIGGTGVIKLMQDSGRWTMNSYIMDKGWGCAACIYNRIAEMNGAITTAILNIPMPTRYPYIMEEVYEQKRKQDESVTFSQRFEPSIAKGAIEFNSGDNGLEKANAMWHAFDFWQQGGGVSSPHSAPTGNAIVDTINALMGTEGLFNMRQNASIHPIAQLSGAGRSLVEAAVRNLSYAAIGAGSGMGLKFLGDDFFAQSASSAAGFLITFAMISLTAGFILFYVVPFLPFIYFFFAFGGWVKGIFEAMVGAPLWALAHIRIDGNGLSGQAALSGYFLIFEVFLRPILMVFGLIASISIFSALVKVLNQIFTLVVVNLMGFDVNAEFTLANGIGTSDMNVMRGAIDEFFFTVVYVLIVYMMGMSSFKLVDLIPNNILRWMGQTVATFGDQKDDPTQKLVSTATVGSQQATNAVGGGLQQLAGMAGR